MNKELEEAQAQVIKDRNADFFITELVNMSGTYERQYASLSRRVATLEQNAKGQYDDDPMKGIGTVIGIIVAIQLLPVIVEAIQSWRGKAKG